MPGAVGGGATGVVGTAEASEKCGNMEEKRGPVQVSLTCKSRSSITQLGNETLRSGRRDRLDVRRGGGSANRCCGGD